MKKNDLNRREFIGRTIATGIAASLSAKVILAKEQEKEWLNKSATVIRVSHSESLNSEGLANNKIVQAMVDRVLCEFTSSKEIAEAWSHFIEPDDVVGINTNNTICHRYRKIYKEVITYYGYAIMIYTGVLIHEYQSAE